MFRSIGGVLSGAPALVAWGPHDDNLFALGVGADSALQVAQLSGLVVEEESAAWTPWQSLGGVVMSEPCAVRTGDSEVDAFAVGDKGDLLHWRFADGSWEMPLTVTAPHVPTRGAADVAGGAIGLLSRRFESLGGTLTSKPQSVLIGEGVLMVMARGADHALWARVRAQGVWRDWESLGHRLASPPHAVVWQKETFVAAALGTDSAIWYTTGAAWNSLGGQYSTAPYLVAGQRHVYLFAVDSAAHALQYRTWDGKDWSGWTPLDGIVMSPPTANGSPDLGELIHVFGIGTDSAVWRRRNIGDSWASWESLGGPFLSAPATVIRRPGDGPPGTGLIVIRDMVALGTDHTLWHLETED
jgi:hypothetical protein